MSEEYTNPLYNSNNILIRDPSEVYIIEKQRNILLLDSIDLVKLFVLSGT